MDTSLKPGMVIRLFEDTDRRAYVELLEKKGFICEVHNDRIVITKRYKPTYDLKRLGEILRTAREKKGISEEEMTQRIWICKQTLRGWESGRYKPGDYTLKLYCKEVGLDMKKIIKEVKSY